MRKPFSNSSPTRSIPWITTASDGKQPETLNIARDTHTHTQIMCQYFVMFIYHSLVAHSYLHTINVYLLFDFWWCAFLLYRERFLDFRPKQPNRRRIEIASHTHCVRDDDTREFDSLNNVAPCFALDMVSKDIRLMVTLCVRRTYLFYSPE